MFLPHTLRAAIFFHRNNPGGNADSSRSNLCHDSGCTMDSAGSAGSSTGTLQEKQILQEGASSYLMQSPPVIRAAVRRLPRIRPRLFLRSMFKGLIVRDPHCAAALTRGGHWSEVNLWPSELPHNTSVILGAADHLIPVEAVVTQLQSAPSAAAKNVMIQVNPGRGHGAFVLDPIMQTGILALPSMGFSSRVAEVATPVNEQAGVPDATYIGTQCSGVSDGNDSPVMSVSSRWAVFSFLLASYDCAFISWRRQQTSQGASSWQRPTRSNHPRLWPLQVHPRPPRTPRVSSSGGSQVRGHSRRSSLSYAPSTSSLDSLAQGPSCPLVPGAEPARQYTPPTGAVRPGVTWVARVHSSVVKSISHLPWPGRKM
jgi:hypothetical protein